MEHLNSRHVVMASSGDSGAPKRHAFSGAVFISRLLLPWALLLLMIYHPDNPALKLRTSSVGLVAVASRKAAIPVGRLVED